MGCGFFTFLAELFKKPDKHKIEMMLSGLYLITDDGLDGRLLDRVEAALASGVRILQYRDKTRDRQSQLELAAQLKELCRRYQVLFLINDSAELAAACAADGVHLGQDDGSIAQARTLLGERAVIGISVDTVEEALAAQEAGASYIGVGAIYPTSSKSDAVHVGLDMLRKVRAEVRLPIVAIGGITRDRAPEVLEAGADSLAVISSVMSDPQPGFAAREFALLFNRGKAAPAGRVLTIAGSDSGGGAGIQADLKTITLLGSYASSVLTALTAQNTTGVSAIHAPPADFVTSQLNAVLSDIGTDTAKTGMLYSAPIIRAVTEAIREYHLLVVVDPVMIAKGGSHLLQPEAVNALREDLFPATYLLTPNIPEAEALSGMSIRTEDDMRAAALKLQKFGPRNVLIKGGHMEGDAVDLLLDYDKFHRFPGERFVTRHTHGTGCTFSAAIATFLAQGQTLPEAVGMAKQFISNAIRSAVGIGSGHGPVNHFLAARSLQDGPSPS